MNSILLSIKFKKHIAVNFVKNCSSSVLKREVIVREIAAMLSFGLILKILEGSMLEKPSYEDLEQEVRRLHTALGKKESDLCEIQKLASIGNWEWNIEQQILIWSDEVYRIFGFEPASFKPTVEAFEATIHPDDVKSFLNQRQTMLSEKKISCIDHRIVRPDGSIRYVQECTQLILNEQNEVCRVIGTVQDITSQKQMEETLKDSENKYRTLFDNSLEAILLTAQDGSIFAANQAACYMLGMSEAEIISGGRNAVVNLNDSRLQSALEERKKNGKFRGELTYKKKDGTIFPVELSSAVFKNNHGNEMTCISVRDITERKLAEKMLQQSEERLRLSLAGADLGMWDWNVESGAVTFNGRWATMLGYALNEIEPHVSVWETLLHPDDMPNVMQNLKDHFEGKTDSYTAEHRLRHKSGNWIWVLDSGRVIERDLQGKAVRACGTHLDITERKKSEEERELLISELQNAMRQVKHLSGLLPICMHCKKIRNDDGYWKQIEVYIQENSEAQFSHSICRECAKKHYPDIDIYDD